MEFWKLLYNEFPGLVYWLIHLESWLGAVGCRVMRVTQNEGKCLYSYFILLTPLKRQKLYFSAIDFFSEHIKAVCVISSASLFGLLTRQIVSNVSGFHTEACDPGSMQSWEKLLNVCKDKESKFFIKQWKASKWYHFFYSVQVWC